MKKYLQLAKLVLMAAAIMLVWKWSTILVLELSEINYDVTEKVLRYMVLGGTGLMICVVVYGIIADNFK